MVTIFQMGSLKVRNMNIYNLSGEEDCFTFTPMDLCAFICHTQEECQKQTRGCVVCEACLSSEGIEENSLDCIQIYLTDWI